MATQHEHRADGPLITYTLFPNLWPKQATERADVPWQELVGRIYAAPTYIAKSACPLISLAAYGPTLSDHGSIRHAANVRQVFGVEIDYDGEEVSPEEGARRLAEARLQAILYTSPSHTPGAPRWRVLAPLAEPAVPAQRAEYVGRVNRALGGIATRESFTLSQSFYIGRVRGATYVVTETEGRCVDEAADLEPLYYTGHSDGASPRDARTDDELRAAFDAGQDRYQAMLKLSARWAARGLAIDDIMAALHGLLGDGPGTHNADGVDLRTRIEPIAVSAVHKFGGRRTGHYGGAVDVTPAPPDVELPPIEAYADDVHSDDPPPLPPAEGIAPTGAGRRMRWLELDGREAPQRTWLVDHWLTHGLTLLAGRGGVGKTLLAQTLGTALALGRPFIGDVAAPQTVLMWACEDDHDEIWRRQIAINRYLGCTMADIDGRLVIESRVGATNGMWVQAFGALTAGPALKEWHEQIADVAATVAILDNISHAFGGTENDRHHVTSFVNSLAPTTERPLATILLGHVAKAQGSEFAGSTAWENAVRMRWFFGDHLPDQKPDEAQEPEQDVRYLAKRKANYSTNDWRRLIWQRGVFAAEAGASIATNYAAQARKDDAKRCVLSALRKIVASGLTATASTASSEYLPKSILRMKLGEDYTQRELAEAMSALLVAGRIRNDVVGQYANRTPKKGLVEVPL